MLRAYATKVMGKRAGRRKVVGDDGPPGACDALGSGAATDHGRGAAGRDILTSGRAQPLPSRAAPARRRVGAGPA
jgi:hypothetical protein